MTQLPGAIFVVDTKREDIAIHEAQRLRIPIIGLVDTNADPDDVDYVIPGNDDAIRSVALMCHVIGDAIIDGRGGVQPEGVPAVVASEAVVPTVVTEPVAPVAVAEPVAEPVAVQAPADEATCVDPTPAADIEAVAEAAAEAPAAE
jgi:small subunit ribosomal protein S2